MQLRVGEACVEDSVMSYEPHVHTSSAVEGQCEIRIMHNPAFTSPDEDNVHLPPVEGEEEEELPPLVGVEEIESNLSVIRRHMLKELPTMKQQVLFSQTKCRHLTRSILRLTEQLEKVETTRDTNNLLRTRKIGKKLAEAKKSRGFWRAYGQNLRHLISQFQVRLDSGEMLPTRRSVLYEE